MYMTIFAGLFYFMGFQNPEFTFDFSDPGEKSQFGLENEQGTTIVHVIQPTNFDDRLQDELQTDFLKNTNNFQRGKEILLI